MLNVRRFIIVSIIAVVSRSNRKQNTIVRSPDYRIMQALVMTTRAQTHIGYITGLGICCDIIDSRNNTINCATAPIIQNPDRMDCGISRHTDNSDSIVNRSNCASNMGTMAITIVSGLFTC